MELRRQGAKANVGKARENVSDLICRFLSISSSGSLRAFPPTSYKLYGIRSILLWQISRRLAM